MKPTPARPAADSLSCLQDFEPLLPAEALVMRAAASGGIAKIGYRRPRSAAPDLRLRAEFLAFLLRGGSADAPVAGRRLQILGACIVGCLDLRDASVPVSLWMYRCVFGTTPVLDGAHVRGSMAFPDSALPGFAAEGCRIDGELAFNAGCSLHGELQLTRAVIGRDLNCERLQLHESEKFTPGRPCRVVADGMSVAGDLVLAGAEAVGELHLRAARVGGELRATGARLSAPFDPTGARGVALNLDCVEVRGNVRLDRGFTAAGQVRAQRARIDGDLDCSSAGFDAAGDAGWDDARTVLLDGARIGGALILRELQAPLQGASLVDATVGSLADDVATWGQHHVLDGFSYRRVGAHAPTDAATRLGWLDRQHASQLGSDFRPDPWRRLIGVLRGMGHGRSAAAVAIGRERHLRRAGLIGRDLPAWLRWLPRVGHDLFGLFAGYGHRPLRVLGIATLLWLACGAAYWAAAADGAMAPSGRVAAAPFVPLAYSLDVLVPLLDLGQARRWAPAVGGRSNVALMVLGLSWFEALCGWLAALTLLVGTTGLADRDWRERSA